MLDHKENIIGLGQLATKPSMQGDET